MNYIALYRKWRPQVFEELIGQSHITRTLQNALQTGRVSHAYLFCGPRGTGKTSTAKILAKALNCEKGTSPQPCNRCPICEGINLGRVMDVLEIDAASNRGIDEIRELREKVRYGSTQARYKVYIIDEVHMLTPEAFNALLKTLEEPPGRVIFILATTEPHKLPLTILSRCQRFDFHRISVPVLVEGLSRIASREGVTVEKGALNLIARSSEGAMRDALSLLEQVIAFGDNSVNVESIKQILGIVEEEVFIKLGRAVLEKDLVTALKLVREVVDRGQNIRQFVKDLADYFRGLILLKIQEGGSSPLELYWASQEQMKEQAAEFSLECLMYINDVFTDTVFEFRGSSQPRFILETAVFQICQVDFQLNLRTLQKKIEELESLILSRKEIPQKTKPKGRDDLPDEDNLSGSYDKARDKYKEDGDQKTRSEKKDQQVFKDEVPEVPEVPDPINPEEASVDEALGKSKEMLRGHQKEKVLTDAKKNKDNKKDDLSIKEFQKVWDIFLKELKQKDIMAYSYLSEGRPSSITGNILTIEVKNVFFQEKLKKPDLVKLIKEAFRRFHDSEVKLKIVLGEKKGKGPEEENKNYNLSPENEENNAADEFSDKHHEEEKEADSAADAVNNQEDSLEKVAKMFRGKVIEIKEIKKGGSIFDG